MLGGIGVGVAGVKDRQQQRAGADERDQAGVTAGDDGIVAAGRLSQDMGGEVFFAGIEQRAGHAQLTGQDQRRIAASFGCSDGAIRGDPSGAPRSPTLTSIAAAA
ncbi:MAG TPA: hypothetical protein VLZ05_17695 [Mycobacterium sp.]|nr:hypothetical protein [Mycobacterium sp.]HUH70525.1 hypothetical protein [Mycobacterium sp.]